MMEEKTIPKRAVRVKGTVLFTVVSVMMVLIVFLTATLALAATANNRALNNFNSVQTQQTAKAAVQSIMAAMQNDKTIARAVSLVDASTSLELNKDDIKFEDPSLGTIDSAKIEYYGSKYMLDGDTTSSTYMQMVSRDVFKISATASQGRESSTVAAYVLKDSVVTPPTDGNNTGFVSTGGAGMSNHVSAFGGTYLGFDKDFKTGGYGNGSYSVTNGEAFETDTQINGDFTSSSGPMTLVIKKPGTGLTVWGNLTLNNSGPLDIQTVHATTSDLNGESYTKIPYIYVEKTLALNYDNNSLGDPNIPLNVFCGDIDMTANGKDIYADVYCYDAGATSEIQTTGSSLYKWTASVVNADGSTGVSAGNFYTKGNLNVKTTSTFDGDVVCEGDFTVDGSVTINGSLAVKGRLIINSGKSLTVKGSVYCDNVEKNGTLTCTPATEAVLNTGYQLLPTKLTKDGGGWRTESGTYYTVPAGEDWSQTGGVGVPWKDNVKYDAATGDYVWNWSDEVRWNENSFMLYYDPSGNICSRAAAVATEPEETGSYVLSPISFPKEYEKDIILGENTLSGKTVSETKIVTTVQDILNDKKSDPYETLTDVPDEYLSDVAATPINLSDYGNDATIVINKSCTIKGSLGDRSKVLFEPPTGTTIWVKTDGVINCPNNSCMILNNVDSTKQGTVNLLLTDDVNFTGNNNPVFTVQSIESMITSGTPFQFATEDKFVIPDTVTVGGVEKLKYPLVTAVNFNIYSTETKKNSTAKITVSLQNSTRIIANIKAPNMKLRYESAGSPPVPGVSEIYYNGFNVLDNANTKQIGGIGCCIVNDFYCQNNWVLLFVGGDGGDGGDDDFYDALMRSWRIQYYENY